MKINTCNLLDYIYRKVIAALDKSHQFTAISLVQDLMWTLGRHCWGLPLKFFDIERDYIYNAVGTANALILLDAYQSNHLTKDIRLVHSWWELNVRLKEDLWICHWAKRLEGEGHILWRAGSRRFMRSGNRYSCSRQLEKTILKKSVANKILSVLLEMKDYAHGLKPESNTFDSYFLYSIGHYGHLDYLVKASRKNSTANTLIFSNKRLCACPPALDIIKEANPGCLVLEDRLPYLNLYGWNNWIRSANSGVVLTSAGNLTTINGYKITRQFVLDHERDQVLKATGYGMESVVCIHLRESTFKGWESVRDSQPHAHYESLYSFLLERFERIVFLGNNVYRGKHIHSGRVVNLNQMRGVTFNMQVSILKMAELVIGSGSGITHLTTVTGTPCIYVDLPHFGNMILPDNSRHLVKLPADRWYTEDYEINDKELSESYDLLMRFQLNELIGSGDRTCEYKLCRGWILNNTPVQMIMKAVAMMGSPTRTVQPVNKERYLEYRKSCNSDNHLNEIGLGVVDYRYL